MIVKSTSHKRIIISGNSLSWFSEGNVEFGMRFPSTLYSSIVALQRKIAFHNFSTGGIQTSQLITNFPTLYAPYIRTNDIVIFWELINDLRVQDNATTAYNNAVTYCNMIRATGAKCILLTAIANNSASQPADIETIRLACNTDLVANQSSICDLLIDVASLPHFDALADTANATYYNADLAHLTNVGYDEIATFTYNSLVSNNII